MSVSCVAVCAIACALQAALADNRVAAVRVENHHSFMDLMDRPLQHNGYPYAIPDVLRYYGIADLKAALGRRLHD